MISPRLKNPDTPANKANATKGIGWGSLATMGEKIDIDLPKILQTPYAVASKTVGKS